jgi:hypothetical protein
MLKCKAFAEIWQILTMGLFLLHNWVVGFKYQRHFFSGRGKGGLDSSRGRFSLAKRAAIKTEIGIWPRRLFSCHFISFSNLQSLQLASN